MLIAGDTWLDRNGGWVGICGLVVAILSIAVAVFLYYRGKVHRRLDYEVESLAAIINPAAAKTAAADGLVVTWNQQQLEKAFTCQFTIKNTGTVALRPADYTVAPRLLFGENTCYSAQVSRASERCLIRKGDQLIAEPSRQIMLDLPVIERDEWFEITMLIDGPRPQAPKLEVKIADGEPPQRISDGELRRRRWLTIAGIVAAVIVIGVFVLVSFATSHDRSKPGFAGATLGVSAGALFGSIVAAVSAYRAWVDAEKIHQRARGVRDDPDL